MTFLATHQFDLPPQKAVLRPGPSLKWWTQLKLVRRDFLGYLSACSERYGDLFCIQPMPHSKIFVVNSMDLAREILQERQSEFQKSSQTRFMVGKFLGAGLVLSEGEEHHRQKNMLLPNFSNKNFSFFSAAVSQIVNHHLSNLDPASPVDIEPLMTSIAMESILSFLTGAAPTSNGEHEEQSAFRDLAVAIGGRFTSMPLPSWVPTRRNSRERTAVKKVALLVEALLEHSRKDGHQADCMLSNLGRRLDQGEITNTFVRDQMVTMLFAGHETVAKAMTWALYLVAGHSTVQEQVAEDIRKMPREQGLRIQDLPRLRSLNNVVKETLRLYPPVWVFDRSPIIDTMLGGQKISSRDIVYVSPYLLHRQARYFANPLNFEPARFVDNEIKEHPAYIPYGLGARGCIGKSIAGIETALVVAQILAKWKLTLVDGTGAKPNAGATLAPSAPILIGFERR